MPITVWRRSVRRDNESHLFLSLKGSVMVPLRRNDTDNAGAFGAVVNPVLVLRGGFSKRTDHRSLLLASASTQGCNFWGGARQAPCGGRKQGPQGRGWFLDPRCFASTWNQALTQYCSPHDPPRGPFILCPLAGGPGGPGSARPTAGHRGPPATPGGLPRDQSSASARLTVCTALDCRISFGRN